MQRELDENKNKNFPNVYHQHGNDDERWVIDDCCKITAPVHHYVQVGKRHEEGEKKNGEKEKKGEGEINDRKVEVIPGEGRKKIKEKKKRKIIIVDKMEKAV